MNDLRLTDTEIYWKPYLGAVKVGEQLSLTPALQVYEGGVQAGQVFRGGMEAGQIYEGGIRAGQVES